MLIAYVDPSLGMLIWQAIVAAFVGTMFYLNKTRRWIVATIRNIFGRGQIKTPATHIDEHGNKPQSGAAETEGGIDAK